MSRFDDNVLDKGFFVDKMGEPLSDEDLLKREEQSPADYSQIPPTPGEAIRAIRDTGPASWLDQAVRRGHYSDADPRDIYANTLTVGRRQDQELGLPPQGEMLDAAEANARYTPKGGEELFSKPISDGLAQVVAKQSLENLKNKANIERYENVHSWPANVAMNIVGSMLDPADLAAMFVPGIGEEAVAARLGGGVVARMAGRAVSGAIGGAAASVPDVGVHSVLDDQFTLRDAFGELALGAAGGALLQGIGEGGLRELGALGPDKLMRDAAAAGISVAQNHAAISSAVAQIIEEQPVNVVPILHPPPSDLQVRNVRMYLAATGQKADEETIMRAAAIARTGEDIDVALREAQKERPPATLAQVAAEQKALQENGYAQGFSNTEFQAAKESVNAAAVTEPESVSPLPTEKPSAEQPEAELLSRVIPSTGRTDTDRPAYEVQLVDKDSNVHYKMDIVNDGEDYWTVRHIENISRKYSNKAEELYGKAAEYVHSQGGRLIAGINTNKFSQPVLDRMLAKGSARKALGNNLVEIGSREPHPLIAEADANPKIQEALTHPQINDKNDVPYMAGASAGDSTVTNIDLHVPRSATIDGVTFDPAIPANIHEQYEKFAMEKLIAQGMSESDAYTTAHHLVAEVAERRWVEAQGINWDHYQAWWNEIFPKIDHENPVNPPADLYKKPYPHDDIELAKHEPTTPVPEPTAKEKAAAEGESVEKTAPIDPEVIAAQSALDTAQTLTQAYEQAAQCLVEAGL